MRIPVVQVSSLRPGHTPPLRSGIEKRRPPIQAIIIERSKKTTKKLRIKMWFEEVWMTVWTQTNMLKATKKSAFQVWPWFDRSWGNVMRLRLICGDKCLLAVSRSARARKNSSSLRPFRWFLNAQTNRQEKNYKGSTIQYEKKSKCRCRCTHGESFRGKKGQKRGGFPKQTCVGFL